MRRTAWFTFILILCLVAGLPATAIAAEGGAFNRMIADRMTPAVNRPYVRVILKVDIAGKVYDMSYGASGTGWFVTPDGVMLTNAHVVDSFTDPQNDVIASQFQKYAVDKLGVKTTADLQRLMQQAKVVEFKRELLVFLPWGGNPVPAQILKTGHRIGVEPNDDVAVLKVSTGSNYITLPVGKAKDLRKGQTIFLLGYPGVADLFLLDKNNPAFRSEATFAVGNVSAVDKTVSGRQTPQLNVTANHGNSGGPVLDANMVSVGLLTFGNPEASHTEWAMPGELAQEFLNAVGVTPSKGQATELYEAALAAFYKNDLASAKANLDKLFAIAPYARQTSNIQKILEDIGKGKGGDDGTLSKGKETVIVREESGSAVPIALLSLGGVAVLGVLFFVFRGRKEDPNKPIREAGVIGFQAGPLAGQQIPLSKSLVVGRDPARSRVVLNDPQVSGAHCELAYTAGGVMLKDLASTNGTFVNGQRVQEKLLKHGDIVTLGGSPYTAFTYLGGVAPQAAGTVALNSAAVREQAAPAQAQAQAQAQEAPPAAQPGPQQPAEAAGGGRLIRRVVPGAPPQVRFDGGPLAGQVFPLTQAVIIGSEQGRVHILIPHPQVSGYHCELHPTPQGIQLIDRGSAAGTYLAPGGQQRVSNQYLQPGQRVFLGPTGEVSFTIS